MPKPKLLSTRPLFEPVRETLDEHFDMEYWTRPERIPRDEFLARVAGKNGLICLLTEKVDEELLAQAPNLRLVATVSVGFDNIDVPACTRHGVVAANTPDVVGETTADFAWVLIFAVARRLLEGVEMIQSQSWTGWDLDLLCGADVWGKTLGVVGLGRIGRAVARRAQGFRMKVLYSDALQATGEVERELGAEYVSLERLLAVADFISLHVPLLPATRHLISTAQLARMKKSAFLINTSRGPVIDEKALIVALDEGQIAGAALDVYENEPRVNAGLLGRKNVVLTPHIASASLETRTKMAAIAAENAIALFSGRRPPNAINPDVLEKSQSSSR
jgi:glyoxylate reductase